MEEDFDGNQILGVGLLIVALKLPRGIRTENQSMLSLKTKNSTYFRALSSIG